MDTNWHPKSHTVMDKIEDDMHTSYNRHSILKTLTQESGWQRWRDHLVVRSSPMRVHVLHWKMCPRLGLPDLCLNCTLMFKYDQVRSMFKVRRNARKMRPQSMFKLERECIIFRYRQQQSYIHTREHLSRYTSYVPSIEYSNDRKYTPGNKRLKYTYTP